MSAPPPSWRAGVKPLPLVVTTVLVLGAVFLVLESWSTGGTVEAVARSFLGVTAIGGMKGTVSFAPRVLFPNAWGHQRSPDPGSPLAIVVADVFLVGKCLGVASHLDQDPAFRYSLRNMSITFMNPPSMAASYNSPLRLLDVRENDGWETSSMGWLCLPELADVDAVEVGLTIDATEASERFTAYRDWAGLEEFASRSDGVLRTIRGFSASGAALSLEASPGASRCPPGGGGLAIMTLLSERDVHIAPAWIDHWRSLGASQFYLYWNGDPTRLATAAGAATLLAIAGQPDVILIAWPLPYRTRSAPSVKPATQRHCAQTVSIYHALSRFGHCHDWLAHMDLDEWVLPGQRVLASPLQQQASKKGEASAEGGSSSSGGRSLRSEELLVRGAPAAGALAGKRASGVNGAAVIVSVPLEGSLFVVLPQPVPTSAPDLPPKYSPKQQPPPFAQSIPPKDRWTGSKWLARSFLGWLETSCLKRACVLAPHWATVKFAGGATKWSAALASEASLAAVANATATGARSAAAADAPAATPAPIEVPPLLSRDMAAATLLVDASPVPGKRHKIIYGLRGSRLASRDQRGDVRQRLFRHPGVHQSRELNDHFPGDDTWYFAHVLNLGVSAAHVSVTQWEIDKEVKAMVAAAAGGEGGVEGRVVLEDAGVRLALKSAGVPITTTTTATTTRA